jgi:nitrate reductase NapAB chaperone NapD
VSAFPRFEVFSGRAEAGRVVTVIPESGVAAIAKSISELSALVIVVSINLRIFNAADRAACRKQIFIFP